MVNEDGEASGRYIVVKALEDGVVIMGLTRGKDTRSHHSERLDAGEVLVAHRSTRARFDEATDAEIEVVARSAHEVLGRLASLLGDPPYNLVVHTAPAAARPGVRLRNA